MLVCMLQILSAQHRGQATRLDPSTRCFEPASRAGTMMGARAAKKGPEWILDTICSFSNCLGSTGV